LITSTAYISWLLQIQLISQLCPVTVGTTARDHCNYLHGTNTHTNIDNNWEIAMVILPARHGCSKAWWQLNILNQQSCSML